MATSGARVLAIEVRAEFFLHGTMGYLLLLKLSPLRVKRKDACCASYSLKTEGES